MHTATPVVVNRVDPSSVCHWHQYSSYNPNMQL